MRRISLIWLLFLFVSTIQAQDKYPVYCDVYLFGERSLSKNATIGFDFGFDRNVDLLDENGKKMKFPSVFSAVNYLAKKGWKLFSAVSSTNTAQIILLDKTLNNIPMVMHYIMTKDVASDDEILDGLNVTKHKKNLEYKEKKMSNDGYYY